MLSERPANVAIVGGGPAGLSCAIELKRLGADRVVVLEREAAAGGVPRHTNHVGFGVLDLHRMMSGPTYAARLVSGALARGVEVLTGTVVTGRNADGSLVITGPNGSQALPSNQVVLATGVRERPRSARLIPGDRPAGIFTTGSLQRWQSAGLGPVGQRGVVVGAEHVSFSATITLRHLGCRTVGLVTPHARHQSYPPLRWAARAPVLTNVSVAEVVGKGRVEAVVLTDGRRIECDTVVFTADWIPEHALARTFGLAIDPGSRGPVVDANGRSSVENVWAIGNLCHGAETADRCALEGRHTARALMSGTPWPAFSLRPIEINDSITWAVRSAGGVVAQVAEARRGRLVADANGVRLWTGRRRLLLPGRRLAVPDLPVGSRLSVAP